MSKMISKVDIFNKVQDELMDEKGFRFERVDFNRPWGGFFVIKEEQAQLFVDHFYKGEDLNTLSKGGRISPKILVVAPNKRLSWQYHHRRSEVWKLIEGESGIVRSMTDEMNEVEQMNIGEKVVLQKGERHRLVGLNDFGIIAEIWQHTDPNHLSDENDIVRLQDDFKRT